MVVQRHTRKLGKTPLSDAGGSMIYRCCFTGPNGFDYLMTTDERNPKDDARKARKNLNGTDFSQNGYNALMLTQNALAFA